MNILNIPAGTIIDNNEIVKKIGDGYTGVVYCAKDNNQCDDSGNPKKVALKILKESKKDSNHVIQRFKDEYQRQFFGKKHTNIAEVYQFGSLDGHFFFTSELVGGYKISTVTCGLPIDIHNEKDPHYFKYSTIVGLFIQLLEGLDFIHRAGLLHLDIKAENVFIQPLPSDKFHDSKTASKQGGIVKIVDFGLAAVIGEAIRLGGTPHYVAPEIVLGLKDEIDARADLFSAAILMYYCLTSTFPFHKRWGASDLKGIASLIDDEMLPEPPSRWISEIPAYLDTIIMRLLAKKPCERFYPNARAVINALLTNQPDAFGSGAQCSSYLHPIADKHIGRKTEQTLLNSALEELIGGKQPEQAIFSIRGGSGLGKSHLLQTIRRKAELNSEKINLAYIQMPADAIALEGCFSKLTRDLTENNMPILILIDDLHELVDVSTQHIIIGFLNYVKDKLLQPFVYTGTKPIVVCYAYDSDKNLSGYDNVKTAHIDLKPFSGENIEEYLRATPALKEKGLLSDWEKELYSKTLGIPGFLVACLEELNAGGFLFDPLGNLHVANIASFKEKPPPPLLRDHLLKKYNSLSATEKEIVNLIAVWNFKRMAKPIKYSDIGNFFYSVSLGQVINTLVDKGVIQYTLGGETERAILFANECFNHVVYENMQQEKKEIMHDSLASYLKTDKNLIALHVSYGSDKAKALESINEIGRYKLFKEGNATLATELLGYGLKISNDSVWKLSLASLLMETHYHSGRYKQSEDIYNESIKYIDDLVAADRKHWKIELAIKLIPSLIERQLFDKADKIADEMLALCTDGGIAPTILILQNFKAAILYKKSQFDLEKSGASLQRALEIYERNEQIENTLSEADRDKVKNNELGIVLRLLGNHTLAVSKLKKKLSKIETASNVFDIFLTTFSLAESCRLASLYNDATKYCKKAFTLAVLPGKSNWLMLAHDLIANVYYDMGRFDEAREESNKCISLCACLGPGYEDNCFYSLLRIGHCFKEDMQFKKAEMYFETVVNKTKQFLSLMYAHLGLGEVYCHGEKYSASLEHIMIAEKILMNLPASISVPYTHRINELKTSIAEKRKNLKN